MCLITFNWKNHPKYKLILVANRDEFFQRPSAPLQKWESGFYAGKDLKAGGTWMGVHPHGRFAALTNYRDLKNPKENPKTRGDLVKDFLEGDTSPSDFLKQVDLDKDNYEGFNILLGDGQSMFYFSNYKEGIEEIEPGLYGLSNALLDTPWTKLTLAKSKLQQAIDENALDPEELMQVVHSKKMDPDELLPNTGATLYQERHLSAQFIKIDDYYGTVNTTVLLWGNDDKIEIIERTFDQIKNIASDQKISFLVSQ
ncbi:NRDE family protein [Belliella kenyensis]|uniref:NRDE family protein n=1 Tax=Belliella kenyensis TaxID=1472724 RepID=A0ABV8EQX7_9BACT|nr:NRDE family protein [Belliella kenyensis]MCH7402847.1 NRDE family protein [Belliella kenyensis]MDN3602553.1 NRDE family protein [Belliella kenyensis]